MIELGQHAPSTARRAFSYYLRTGRRLPDEIETKFNPYHDPRNGQFTFAPGGPRSLRRVIISDRRPKRDARTTASQTLNASPPRLSKPSVTKNPRARSGGNIRAFQDPMTLQQVFPGLRTAPGGAIVALGDNLLDVTGPANRLTASLTEDYSRVLINQIQSVDPSYRFESLGAPSTLEGQINQINTLRLERAGALYRIRGEVRPLQVETLRFLQSRADAAYVAGWAEFRAGRLNVRLSPEEAVGNYIDRRVRSALRDIYTELGISTSRGGPVRVNSREYDTTGTDLTYRVPDARIGNVAFDVTLTRKTPSSPQIRGFFAADFRPGTVVIVRPSQLGASSTYAITRSGN